MVQTCVFSNKTKKESKSLADDGLGVSKAKPGYRGGVVAILGVGDRATATGDFESGCTGFGLLLRFAMTCIFFRRAVRRARILWTTVIWLAPCNTFTSIAIRPTHI